MTLDFVYLNMRIQWRDKPPLPNPNYLLNHQKRSQVYVKPQWLWHQRKASKVPKDHTLDMSLLQCEKLQPRIRPTLSY